MPNYLTAKNLAEEALREIGAFPPSQSQADAGELRVTLLRLELMLNSYVGMRTMAGLRDTVEIPLIEGETVYRLEDYTDENSAQHVFSIMCVENTGNVTPVDIVFDSQAQENDLTQSATPWQAVVSQNVKPVITVWPKPTASDVSAGRFIRVRLQTYAAAVDPQGIADKDTKLRPSWYWWAITKTAYAIGRGAVRRLSDGELKLLREDSELLENRLLAYDGSQDTSQPHVTEPMMT